MPVKDSEANLISSAQGFDAPPGPLSSVQPIELTDAESLAPYQGAIFLDTRVTVLPHDGSAIPFQEYKSLLHGNKTRGGKQPGSSKRKASIRKGIPIGAHRLDEQVPDLGLERRKAKAADLSGLRETAEGFQFRNWTQEVRVLYDIGTDAVVEGVGYAANSQNGLNWFFLFPDEEYKLELLENPIQLNGAAKALSMRQALVLSDGENRGNQSITRNSKKDHDAVVGSLIANWGKVNKYFYKQNPVAGRYLQRWHELYLNDHGVIYQRKNSFFESHDACGIPDFVGEGPDYRSIKIEVGAPLPHKVHQSIRHDVGLIAVIEDANAGHEAPPVDTFIASFWKNVARQETIVQFHAPEEIQLAFAA